MFWAACFSITFLVYLLDFTIVGEIIADLDNATRKFIKTLAEGLSQPQHSYRPVQLPPDRRQIRRAIMPPFHAGTRSTDASRSSAHPALTARARFQEFAHRADIHKRGDTNASP